MRLTAKQLRNIIAEEVTNLKQFDARAVTSGGDYPDEPLPQDPYSDNREYGEEPSLEDLEAAGHEEELAHAAAANRSLPDRMRRESSHRRGKRIAEGHTRITEEEVAAWKSGDWGFNSQQDSVTSKLDDHERFLHGSESGHPMDDEGYMVKSRMAAMKTMAADICELLDAEDQLPGWVQDLVASSHSDMQHVHDYLMGDEEMRSNTMSPVQQKMPVGEGRFRRRNE